MDRGIGSDKGNDRSADTDKAGGPDAAPSGVILEVREDLLGAGTGAHGQQNDEDRDEAENIGCEDCRFDPGESPGKEDIEKDGERTDENGKKHQLPSFRDVAAVCYYGETLDGRTADVSCAGDVGLPSEGAEPPDEIAENFPQLRRSENRDPMVLIMRVRCVP